MKKMVVRIKLFYVISAAMILFSTTGYSQYNYSGNKYSKQNPPKFNYTEHNLSNSNISQSEFYGSNSAADEPLPPSEPNRPYADGPEDPGCDPLDPSCPIDDGILLLLIAGTGYGVIQLRKVEKFSILKRKS